MPVWLYKWFHIMYAFKVTSGKSAPSSVQRQEVLAGLFQENYKKSPTIMLIAKLLNTF